MSDTADWKALKKKAFDRELANDIWVKLKGRELPDTWDEEQVQGIIERYWHKAIAFSEGY